MGVGHVFFSIMSGVGHQNFVPLRGGGGGGGGGGHVFLRNRVFISFI